MTRLIANWGEKWSKDAVYWGQPGRGNVGTLLGQHEDTKADFRNQKGVYALYDEQGMLLYVGRAVEDSLFHRLRAHCKSPTFGHFTHFSWWGLRYVKQNGELSSSAEHRQMSVRTLINNLEAVMISAARPRCNDIAGDLASIEKYVQLKDERLVQLGVNPPDPNTQPGDDLVETETKDAAAELAKISETEVTVGRARWKRLAIGTFSALGWIFALLLLRLA